MSFNHQKDLDSFLSSVLLHLSCISYLFFHFGVIFALIELDVFFFSGEMLYGSFLWQIPISSYGILQSLTFDQFFLYPFRWKVLKHQNLCLSKVVGGILSIPYEVIWVTESVFEMFEHLSEGCLLFSIFLLSIFCIIIMASTSVFWCNSFAY